MVKRLRFLAFPIISLFALSACKDNTKDKQVKRAEIKFTKEATLLIKRPETDSLIKILDVEIADDSYQRSTGLMYRKNMAENHGMLFVFDEERYQSFYMKNTQIALDIIYLDSDKKVVSIVKNAQPLDDTSLPSELPARYVLEINGGLSDLWGIESGDYIEY